MYICAQTQILMKKRIVPFLCALFCLSCAFAQEQELVILHTNDTHSQIEPYTYKADTNVGGFLRREALVREIRTEHPDLLLFDAGDFSQGTPYFNVFKGYTEVEMMNAMGYDAIALGNHEFDNGSAALAKLLKKADFKVVCANYEFHNKTLAKVVKHHVVLKRNGLKIGVFGLLVDLRTLISTSTYKEITYLDPVATAKNEVKELNSMGCDLIICLSHLGIEEDMVNDFVVAKEVPDIDIIIGGHSHKELSEPVVIGKTRIFQMSNKGKCVGKITVAY